MKQNLESFTWTQKTETIFHNTDIDSAFELIDSTIIAEFVNIR